MFAASTAVAAGGGGGGGGLPPVLVSASTHFFDVFNEMVERLTYRIPPSVELPDDVALVHSGEDGGRGATAELDPEPEPPHRGHATFPPAEVIAAIREDRSDRFVEGAPRFKRPRTTWRPPQY